MLLLPVRSWPISLATSDDDGGYNLISAVSLEETVANVSFLIDRTSMMTCSMVVRPRASGSRCVFWRT